MKKLIKKQYNVSRIVLVILTIVIFKIMFINEDESWNVLPYVFASVIFILSFISDIISNKIIKYGDHLDNNLKKVLYYIFGLPFFSLLIFAGFVVIVNFIDSFFATSDNFGGALGSGLIYLFFVAIGFIGIVLPYVQSLIILVIRGFLKK